MDAFLQVAGVVGFPASLDGLISLFNRVGSLFISAHSDYIYEESRFESCKQRFHMALQAAERDLPADKLAPPMLCIAAVKKKLEEISREMVHARDVRGQVTLARESINKSLDQTEKLVNDLSALTSKGGTAIISNTSDVLKVEQERRTLLKSLLRPENQTSLGRKEMRLAKGLYVEAADEKGTEICRALTVSEATAGPEDGGRFIFYEGKAYIVDRVAFGSTQKEKEKRRSRLGRLILSMREWEDPCVAKISLLVEMQDSFCILSELGGSSSTTDFVSLEAALLQYMQTSGRRTNRNTPAYNYGSNFVYSGDGTNLHQRMRLLLGIASGIETLHDQMVLHEGIGSHNVLVRAVRSRPAGQDDQQLEAVDVKLAGFVSARMVDDLSDRPACSLAQDLFAKRRQIYQSPWRVAGSRYSFECDVYSFGVVMAELHCGASFVHDPSIGGREDILSALITDQTTIRCGCPAILTLIQECMSAEASMVPPIHEVLERLKRIHN